MFKRKIGTFFQIRLTSLHDVWLHAPGSASWGGGGIQKQYHPSGPKWVTLPRSQSSSAVQATGAKFCFVFMDVFTAVFISLLIKLKIKWIKNRKMREKHTVFWLIFRQPHDQIWAKDMRLMSPFQVRPLDDVTRAVWRHIYLQSLATMSIHWVKFLASVKLQNCSMDHKMSPVMVSKRLKFLILRKLSL